MLAELTAALKDVKFGEKESYTGQLKNILSNENIFGPVASAAADFAAKEAFLKAAGTGLREPFSLCEIETVRLPGGAPAYRFSGRSAQWVEARRLRAHLSLSHEDSMAMAYCILETETCTSQLHTME